MRQGCSRVSPTEWKSSSASEPLPPPPHSSFQHSQGWCSASSTEAQGVSRQQIPPFLNFPIPFLDTESVTSSHPQFFLPCLPKMTPALPEVPLHSLSHGRIPTATCKCRCPDVTACEVARPWYLQELETVSDLSWVEKKIKLGEVKFEMNMWPFYLQSQFLPPCQILPPHESWVKLCIKNPVVENENRNE